jgi:hypothetical protein
MSDVKNDLLLHIIPSVSEEGRKIVLNEDQTEVNAAAVLANYSEWLQHKIETAKQEGGRLAVPELAEQCEEGSIGFDKSRALIDDEVSVDQALFESCVVDEDTLRESASRLGIVDGPQLVSALHGDTSLIQVTPPLLLRIEDGSCVGLSAEYEALPGFEVTGCFRSNYIPRLPCPQERLAAPGVTVGAALGNEHRENVSGKRAREREGQGEYAGGKGDHSAYKRPLCECRKSNSLDANPQIQLFLLRSSETNVKDVKANRAALSKSDAYDAVLARRMGELLLDNELTLLDNEIVKYGQNERIILVYEGKHGGEVLRHE